MPLTVTVCANEDAASAQRRRASFFIGEPWLLIENARRIGKPCGLRTVIGEMLRAAFVGLQSHAKEAVDAGRRKDGIACRVLAEGERFFLPIDSRRKRERRDIRRERDDASPGRIGKCRRARKRNRLR